MVEPSLGIGHALVNGLVVGSFIALGAIGLSLVYNIADVPNFAHGEFLMLGAYMALLVNTPHQIPLLRFFTDGTPDLNVIGLAILFSLTFASALGIVYLLGGRRALEGGWWPIDVSPSVALGVHLVVAALLGVYVILGAPGILSGVVLSALLLGILAPLIDKYVFRQFREGEASLATMLIAAMGLAFFLRYTAQGFFGGTVRRYHFPRVRSVAGREINTGAHKYFDFFLGADGLTFRVIDTAAVRNPSIEDPVQILLVYSWPAVLGLVIGVAAASYGAYRWRGSGLEEHEAAQTIGPRIIGAITGLVALLVLGAVFGQPGTAPDDYFYATRARQSLIRLGVVVLAAGLMVGLHVLLKETKLGKAMRASADNLDLAKITGIDTSRVMMSTWIIAGLYAAIAGIVVGLMFHRIVPRMGFNLLLQMFAAVILGGLANVYGAIIGAYVVGLTMEISIHVIGVPPVHRVSMAFLVLLAILLIKPEGIVGSH